ncbi:MAG: chromosome segregation ATPase [Deltaproteobacteria bacterium]|nr:chromosome segregation ATPase [Deltaproteobacteria bacterium]
MKIRRMEVLGFKSFSEKTQIEFPQGVTAVVGPNGCGKSNVVDAIRWALGEQSPKQLRGKAMEDVIFNGTEAKKPLGMAEVTLVFSNENGKPLADYLDYSEIAVSRKLFRSGESEYLINKVPCGLKDITDLFLGTGVGHRAYSIVEQGKMEFVLNAKPEERRILIEEAAGITKYKDRKAAALRKMEATQQNLLRLSDVIGEIKRQMNSLNRQAKKAERYKGYRDEMRAIDLGQAHQTYRSLEGQHQEMQASLQELKDLEVRATAEIQEVESAVERIKVNLLDLERDLTGHQERLSENEGTMKTRETQIELSSRDRENLQKQAFRAEEEIGKLAHQIEEAHREVQGYEASLQDLQQRIACDADALFEKEKIFSDKKAQLNDHEQALAYEKNTLVDLLTRLAHLKNQFLDLNRRSGELLRRQEKVATERTEAEKKAEELRHHMVQQSLQLTDRRNARSQVEGQKEAKTAQLRELQSALAALQEDLYQQRERMNRESSRLNSLLELQRNFEGYQEGVRAILLKRQAQGMDRNGICGLVEDIIETDPEYECVVESVLGEKLQHFIVQNHEESLKAIDYLKAQGSGRSSFIPLQLKPNPYSSPAPSPNGVVTPLLNVVKVKPEFTQLAQYFFGDVWIVPDLRQAIDLWNQDGIWKILVTMDGEVLHPSGVVTGGSKEQVSSGTFHRKREIRDLDQSTEELRKAIVFREEQQEELLGKMKLMEAAIEEMTQALHQEEIRIVSEAKELDQGELELKRWKQEIETLRFEETQLAEERAEVQTQIHQNEIALQEAEQEKRSREEGLIQREQDLQTLKGDIDGLVAELTEAKLRVATLQEKKQNLDQNMERARQTLQENESILLSRREEVQDCLRQMKEAEEKRREAEIDLNRLLSEHQELQSHLEKKRENLRDEREKLEKSEVLGKERRENLHRLHEQKNALSMKLMETDLNLKHLLSGVEDKHRISTETFLSREDDKDYFAPEVEARLAELKSLIESMGEVNLLAIQEFEECRTRLDFLTEQEADLVQSLEALDQAIKKINRTSRKRFAATFDAVNRKFKEIFTTLFGGGRAEMVLTDESNLLETGVEIIVQPPGKKLQNVTLLSGGEKALTSVALIFSLFLINPSPFCMMDEVDAPLDDANIGRFNSMIQELAQKYQIILVTHNKRTMEIADTLYGITMEEPGTSKVVSVKLN